MASALDFLNNVTESAIIEKMLSATNDTFDKRQGSVLYDAIISMALSIYDFEHDDISQIYAAMSVVTAVGDDLDSWGKVYGVDRLPSAPTYAKVIVSNEDEPANVGDLDEGEILTAHEDDSTWEYQGGGIVRSMIDGDFAPFGVLEPNNEYDNVTLVEFGDVVTHGRSVENDFSYRVRILRHINGFTGGSIMEYVNLVLNAYPVEHPEATPFTGAYVFPVGRHCGYVNIYAMYSDCQIPTTVELLALKNYIDPLNAEGYGAGLAPIGHRVFCKQAAEKFYGFRVWINDGTKVAFNNTAVDGEKVKKAIMEYFSEEIASSMWTNDNTPDARGNHTLVRVRTSNIIAKLTRLRESEPAIRSVQLDIYDPQRGRWVVTSDDTMDYYQYSSRVLIPAINDNHFIVMRGNRDWT